MILLHKDITLSIIKKKNDDNSTEVIKLEKHIFA